MSAPSGESRVFRGTTVEAVLAQVREELGPDAVILREREGMVGGIGGFFARRCVEVEAAPGWPSADDETVLALPAHEAAGLYGAFDFEVAEPTNRFMETLLDRAAALDELFVPAAASESGRGAGHGKPATIDARTEHVRMRPTQEQREPEAVRLPPTPAQWEPEAAPDDRGRAIAAVPARRLDEEYDVRRALARSGMDSSVIEVLMGRVTTHLRPLAPTTPLGELMRLAIRSRLETPLGWEGRRTIAFAGVEEAPAAEAVAAVATAHAAAGLGVAVIALYGGRPAARIAARLVDTDVDVLLAHTVRDVEHVLAEVGSADLVLALSSPLADDVGRSAVSSSDRILAIQPDETHLILPVGVDAQGIRRVLDALAPLVPVDSLLPCSAGLTDDLGGAVGVALERRRSLRWVVSLDPAVRAHPADPVMLAEAMLP